LAAKFEFVGRHRWLGRPAAARAPVRRPRSAPAAPQPALGSLGHPSGTTGSAAGNTGLDNADKRAGEHGAKGRENAREHQRGRDKD